MLDRILSKSELLELVDDLSRHRRIVGPVRREDHYFYQQVQRAGQLALEFNYCVYSPREYLLPPRETLFTFSREDNSFSAAPVFDAKPLALIGVHPCDINAIRLLDRVFGREHRDEHYLHRRERMFIVGIDCPQPCTEGVFCGDMGGNAAESGFDVMCYPLEDDGQGNVRYGVIFGTPTGREWILYSQKGKPPSAEDERRFAGYGAMKTANFPRTIPNTWQELPQLLDRSYDSLLWEATARRCYSCGSCNLVCPTCYCFNTFDEVDMTLRAGERKREWDGCQLRDFAEVAGGHNFRPKAASRLRHRIYRKAKWILEREGIPGCVGCARCDRACTAKISSVEIYRQLAEEV